MSCHSDDAQIAFIHALYSQLKVYPQPSQYTVLAAFYLTSIPNLNHKIISLGTGTKCLAECHLTLQGEAVHDSHAEILARRGAVRWLLEEIFRQKDQGSMWIERQADEYRLKEGIQLHMYISTVPCGDASTQFLAAFQDPEIAFLKDSAMVTYSEGTAARGRNHYHLLNVLRTKPGRADSPPTLSLSCSDKIASWSWLGMQGAFGAKFFNRGIYIRKIIIGEVLSSKDADLINVVSADCERALGGRLDGSLPLEEGPYFLHKPDIVFTPIPFMHSRFVVGLKPVSKSSNESLCWYADCLPPPPPHRVRLPLLSSHFNSETVETSVTRLTSDIHSNSGSKGTVQILINGYKRGVSPKHRQRLDVDKFLPRLSKLSMFRLYARVSREVYGTEIPSALSYYDVKIGLHDYCKAPSSISAYLTAKTHLKGPSGPFSAWWEESFVVPTALSKSEDTKGYKEEARGSSARLEGLEDNVNIQKNRPEVRGRRGDGRWEQFNVNGELQLH